MKIDTKYLINLVTKHKDHLSLDVMKPLFQTVKGDCTNVPDCLLMYLLILEYKPRHVVEFSPMLGYSTRYLASALKILDKGSMITVEINQNYFMKTGERLDKAGLLHICHVLSGDAINVVKKEITTRNRQVDFIFIDSDHSYEFGKRYIKEIFPLLAPGCIVMVHDICGWSDKVDPHSIDFRTSLRSVAPKFAEYRAVKEFLIATQLDHTLTHPLFGGHWQDCAWRISGDEVSPKLPENEEFYSAYREIVGYDLNDYRNFQHPNGLVFQL